MERNVRAPHPVPVEVLAAVVERFATKTVESWRAGGGDYGDTTGAPPKPQISTASVTRQHVTWHYNDLDEFNAEYASDERSSASLCLLANDMSLMYRTDVATSLAVEAPSKGDVLYIVLPFDEWLREVNKDSERSKTVEQPESSAKVTTKPGPKRWWHVIGWHDVRNDLVAWIIVAIVLVAVAALSILLKIT